MRILLGVTGGVAARLTPKIVEALAGTGNNEVQIVPTERSLNFWQPEDVNVPIWTDKQEWEDVYHVYTQNKPPVVHISLRDWADMFLVAPLTANTLAKFANGIADNLLTSVARAWPISKLLVIAPAMNTDMWVHPATAEHIAKLQGWFGPNLVLIPPVKKRLTCGVEGVGAMADIRTIVGYVMLYEEVARTHSYHCS